jgi:hypothetical protein
VERCGPEEKYATVFSRLGSAFISPLTSHQLYRYPAMNVLHSGQMSSCKPGQSYRMVLLAGPRGWRVDSAELYQADGLCAGGHQEFE